MFHTILADPPWLERGGGKIKRGADRHYELMKTDQIIQTMLEAPVWCPAESCHLYLWVTNNFLEDGLRVMRELGFRYITMITWMKDMIGLGYYFRGQTEQLLFGTRGATQKPKVRTMSTAIVEKRRAHSQKPEQTYKIIECVSYAPYLEMFARVRRPGWYSWGKGVEA